MNWFGLFTIIGLAALVAANVLKAMSTVYEKNKIQEKQNEAQSIKDKYANIIARLMKRIIDSNIVNAELEKLSNELFELMLNVRNMENVTQLECEIIDARLEMIKRNLESKM